MLIFFVLWATATVIALALHLNWHGLLRAFTIVFLVDLSAAVLTYVADVGSHSRDVPMLFRLIFSLLFAAIACSGLLVPFAVNALRRD